MSVIAFNATIRITDNIFGGLYRVVAVPPNHPQVFLAPIPEKKDSASSKNESAEKRDHMASVHRQLLDLFEREDRLVTVEIEPEPQLRKKRNDLSEKERAQFDYRTKLMKDFLDHEKLWPAITSRRGLGLLVRAVREKANCSRATVYRLFDLLCLHGFDAASLNPRNDRMGGPGVARPYGGTRRDGKQREKSGRKTTAERVKAEIAHPQIGAPADQVAKIVSVYKNLPKPVPKGKQLYDLLIEKALVTKYVETPEGREPVMPPQGTFLNRRQVRYVLDKVVKRIDRVLARTTEGHFNRNLRGRPGYAWQGIAGPGHCYLIDSTIADLYLRSSINRAWIAGRPIVYIVVDLWSTAIVGFYVCWSGPSWEMAKCALFSTFAPPALMGDLWGYQPVMALNPLPTAPYLFLCDRGEYLSMGAKDTESALGINMDYNPAYRPDLKGLVEVLNRIAKDEQYYFLPGAIDARRKEFDLRTDARESAYTLREYVQYLYWIFTQYNLFADRARRMRTEMYAAHVQPTPAGLWHFGHEVGIGYRKIETLSRIITNLLPSQQVVVNPGGIFLGQLKYEFADAVQAEWTALARNFGSTHLTTHRFPGSTSRLWWPNPDAAGIDTFTLSPHARAPATICFDEWLDVYAYDLQRKADREYDRLCASIARLAKTEDQRKRAIALTAEAEAAYSGPKPTMTEARSMETFAEAPAAPATSDVPTEALASQQPSSAEQVHRELMRRLLEADAPVAQ